MGQTAVDTENHVEYRCDGDGRHEGWLVAPWVLHRVANREDQADLPEREVDNAEVLAYMRKVHVVHCWVNAILPHVHKVISCEEESYAHDDNRGNQGSRHEERHVG